MKCLFLLFFVLHFFAGIRTVAGIERGTKKQPGKISELSAPELLENPQKRQPADYDNLQMKDLDNKSVTFGEITKTDSILVISFWATWCKPCMEELNTINDNLQEWNKKARLRFIAVSVDDARSGAKVKSLVNGKGWNFMVFRDQNQDLKRHFGINNLPSIIILKNGKVVSRHVGYTPGNETGIIREIEKLDE